MPALALQTVPNLIDGESRPAESGEWLEKLRPADGSPLCRVARSGAADVDAAVQRGARGTGALGRAHGGGARRPRSRDCPCAAGTARGASCRGRRGDRQGRVARPRRGRRGGRAGDVHRRGGAPLLRADDYREHAPPHGDGRPPARRRRRTADLLQHAAAQRRLEGVPGDLLRQRRRPQALRGDAALRQPLCNNLSQGGVAGRRPQRRAGARRRGRCRSRRASAGRSRQLHGLGGHGTLDRGDRRAAAGEGLSGDGRQERARRVRRRGPGQRRQLGRAVVVLERRPAVRGRFEDRRLRRRVRGVPQPLRRGRRGICRHGTGDQRGQPRPHPRGSRAGERRGWNGVVRRRSASARRLVAWADSGRRRRHRRRALVHRAVRPRDHPLSRAGSGGGHPRGQRLAVRPHVGRPHGQPRTERCGSRRRCSREWSS